MDDSPQPVMPVDLMRLCGVSAALTASHTLGLLDLVCGEPQTPGEFAHKLRLDERLVARVLDVLAAAGLILKCGERYGIPADAPAALQFAAASLVSLQAHFGHTLHALRTGELLPWMEQREATYRSVVGDLGKLYDNVAAFVAAQVHGHPARILDVGCGSGVWSLAIADRHPAAQVTGLDYPSVLGEFTTRAEQLGLAERIALVPGDMFHVELPREYFDVVVLANVLRLEPPPRARELLTRVTATLRPGGQLLVVDALASGTPAKELARATYALHLALRTEEGRVHPQAQIHEWMQEAGLVNLVPIDCGVQITAIGALLGDKAASRPPIKETP